MRMKTEKYTLNREIEANKEIDSTKIKPLLARIVVWVFISILFSVPLTQLLFDSPFKKENIGVFTAGKIAKTDSWMDNILNRNTHCMQMISAWEKQMEEISFLQSYSSPLFQTVLTGILHTGNEKAVVGKDGWLFYEKDISYLTGHPIVSIDTHASNQGKKSPAACISDFAKQLENQGIKLVIMPIPLKPLLYPEKLNNSYSENNILQNQGYNTFIAELKSRNIQVFDPTEILQSMKKKKEKVFLKTDTHWTPEAMEKVAGSLSRFLLDSILVEPGSDFYGKDSIEIVQQGDIYTMLKLKKALPLFPPEKVIIHSILNERGEYWQPAKTAEVLFLGDSFSNIYSLEGMGWGKTAGFAEHLSYFLQQPIDAIRRNDEGSIATRKMLQTEQKKGRNRLAGKKVVIWEFAMRELTQGNWTPLDMTNLACEQSSSFLTLPDTASLLVKATIEDRSASPHPDKVTYADHVIALHLTDLTDEEGNPLQKEALVYMLAMKNRQLTPAASLRTGDVITLKLESWQLHEAEEGAYNRNELDNSDLLLEEPLWGTLIKLK